MRHLIIFIKKPYISSRNVNNNPNQIKFQLSNNINYMQIELHRIKPNICF